MRLHKVFTKLVAPNAIRNTLMKYMRKRTQKVPKRKMKSLIEEIYKMDIETLRKYCLDLLRRDAKNYREKTSLKGS